MALLRGSHYVNSHNVFLAKTGQRSEVGKLLKEHLPPLVQRSLDMRHGKSHFDILSVGTGTGETDVEILKIMKKELQESEHGHHMKIFNRMVEPNEYSCGLYKAAMESLPRSLLDEKPIEVELCRQTFQEYKKMKGGHQQGSVKFDLVHFIHSVYHVDVEEALLHCFEKELNDTGILLFVVAGQDLMDSVKLRQNKHSAGKDKANESKMVERIINIASDNGWKHKVYAQEYSIDVTEVFDEKSTEGNLLLDFLTETAHFREKADTKLVEETLKLIKDRTILKDGKRFGEKKESLIVISKEL
ncbi:histamine N-methyltransferase-like [Stylophora pistillata]|nr:histamine N-methyltransferase-like [Stylophora pistillata]